MIANNDKGLKLINNIDSQKAVIEDIDYNAIALGNPCLVGPVQEKELRSKFSKLFVSKGLKDAVKETYPVKEKIINHMSPDLAEWLYKTINILRGKK